ncbi:hypothetical protein NY2A_b158R [Paramecium bursaria Chlorella virus NY2A]|uniref:Uncharacterized protein b158R n=1 Tax=Paramecium bursaria Chlorella virus NY2A TaxID=46021 RepID=A7IW33_PBCVN|nr:hypothetical protein NY2A_b158R [Paramecium bursaria Chlorella virus NY2A]ABT14557.1 hypothetical protein NY2A_b158R [Paramecium bursaria Chlorella virus NY2A]
MITASDVFVSENIRIFESAFRFGTRWSVVCDLENSLHGPVQLNPLRRRFAHLEVTHQPREDIRSVAYIYFMILKKQSICEITISIIVFSVHFFILIVNLDICNSTFAQKLHQFRIHYFDTYTI